MTSPSADHVAYLRDRFPNLERSEQAWRWLFEECPCKLPGEGGDDYHRRMKLVRLMDAGVIKEEYPMDAAQALKAIKKTIVLNADQEASLKSHLEFVACLDPAHKHHAWAKSLLEKRIAGEQQARLMTERAEAVFVRSLPFWPRMLQRLKRLLRKKQP